MSKYKRGRIVAATVTGIERYGIFVSVDSIYTGLIHISEVSDGFVKNIYEFVNVGETIHAKIVEVDEDFCQLKLSIRGLEYRPLGRYRQRIVETSRGFQPLFENLNVWIEEKFEEIEKN